MEKALEKIRCWERVMEWRLFTVGKEKAELQERALHEEFKLKQPATQQGPQFQLQVIERSYHVQSHFTFLTTGPRQVCHFSSFLEPGGNGDLNTWRVNPLVAL